jgi:hypothetical protein
MDNQSIPAELTDLATGIRRIAGSLTAHYQGSLEFDDLEQQMWLVYCEQADTDFINRPLPYQLNRLAWRTRDWARHELAKMNHIAIEVELDGLDEWEYLALPVYITDTDDDPLAKMIAQETDRDLVQMITQALAILESHNPRTVTVAQELMTGKEKCQIARDLGIGQSAVSGHVQLLRTTLTTVLSQVA